MVVTIHQPEHLPWLGFFDKARQVDVLILLDNVQFRKNYFQNRNRIRSDRGTLWLTVPVLTKSKHSQTIHEVEINNRGDLRWKDKCFASITQYYKKATFWKEHEAFFYNLYSKEWTHLVDINDHIIRYLLGAFSIHVDTRRSSEIGVNGQRGNLLLNICLKLQADAYLSGVSGREYLDLASFAAAGVEVKFQEFHHPIYKQLYDPFIPCLSAIDLMLNHGPVSPEILSGVGVPTMDEVFQ